MSLRAIVWKEVREQYLRGGRPTASLLAMLGVDLVVGVIVPLTVGQTAESRGEFLAFATPFAFLVLLLSCLTLPMSVVVDSIAGERERHTLETLLASPARDRDIVLGKALSILLVVGLQVATLCLLCLVTWTAIAGTAGLLAALALLAGGLVGAGFLATFTTGLGIVISQRAPTIKQGQQWLAFSVMPFFILPSLAGPLFATFRVGTNGASDASDFALFVAIAGGLFLLVFVVLNALFWTLALKGFRRGRLLLAR